MNLLLSFAPFIVFALIDRTIGHLEALIAGALVAAALMIREALAGRSLKSLEVGTAILFGIMAIYSVAAKPSWSIMDVRLRVDAGLMTIVVVSLLMGKPFTGQYAREAVDATLWETPAFQKTNNVITAVWALAFAILVVADLILIYRPDIPQHVGIWATIAALVGAFKFTKWYPQRVQSQSRF